MAPGRNQPCPCGSGRKYKACCLRADLERERDALPADVLPIHGRLPPAVRAAAAREKTWAADAVPVMVEFEDAEDARPVLVLVTAGELVVGHDVRRRLGGEAADVAEALSRAVSAAGRSVGVLPERLVVRHDEVARALAPILAERDVTVEAGEAPELVEAARGTLEHLTDHDWWPPACRTGTWRAWDLPASLVGDLFAAAAAFHRRAPWREMNNLQAPRVTMPSGREWTCCVLGNAGQEFGLALYSREADLHGEGEAGPEPFAGLTGRILSVVFEAKEDLPSAAVREARQRRWEVAGPSAWPVLITANTPGGGASRADVEDLVTLLRAAPRFADAHGTALVREDRAERPTDPIDWTEPATGVRFRYRAAWLTDPRPLGSLGAEDPDAIRLSKRGAAGSGVDVARVIREVSEELGDDADQDTFVRAVNARLEDEVSVLNARPQAELGGLSPVQVRRLLEADWDDPTGAVQLPALPADRLSDSATLANARALLGLALETGWLGATQAGNLKLDVVAALAERWRGDDDLVGFMRERGKRIREGDVGPIHRLRVVCGLAGLIRKRKGRFELTRRGREMAAPDRAGELFARLFRTWFSEFNLDYGRYLDWPELQRQAAFTLLRLPQAADGWRTAGEILPEVVLPFALERAPARAGAWMDGPESVLAYHFFDPLVDFGLLERRSPGRFPTVATDRYRVTPLAHEFLRFDP